jgi:sn-glycerol 3-phosphate transport system permease protein
MVPAAPTVPADAAPVRPSRRPHRNRHRLSPRAALGRAAVYAALLVGLAIVLFPVYYSVVGMVMTPADLLAYPPRLLPVSGLDWSNLAKAWTLGGIPGQYLTSVTVSTLVTVVQSACAVLAAYAFVFLPLRGRGVWFGLFMATMMIPWEATVIPNFLQLTGWGLIGERWAGAVAAMSLPFLATGFATFLMRQAFLTFPDEVREAAVLDGAGHWRFLGSVLVPMTRPNLAALGIYTFLSVWNQYFWPLLVARNASQQTIQIGISRFRSAEMFSPGTPLAAVVIAVLPAVVIVALGQKQIVRALTVGALK